LFAASQPIPPVVSPDHQPSHLSELLDAKAYLPLARILASVSNGADLRADLDWSKDRMMSGGSSLVSFWYALDLWRAAGALPKEQGDQLRETAGMVTLYTYGAVTIDGVRCADVSAPRHRLDQLIAMNPQLWTFVKSLPADRRKLLADIAVKLEQRTAPKRAADGDDEFVCRGGLEETTYNLKHGSQHEVPTPPGGIGRTILLEGDGKFKPAILPDSIARPKAAKARETLAQTLSALVGVRE
jgi:hypothetical protein